MKTIKICLSCYDVVIDGVYCTSQTEITKLLLKSLQDPSEVYLHKWVCPNCKIFLPEDYVKKLLNETRYS